MLCGRLFVNVYETSKSVLTKILCCVVYILRHIEAKYSCFVVVFDFHYWCRFSPRS